MKINALVVCMLVASCLNAAETVAAPGIPNRANVLARKAPAKAKGHPSGKSFLSAVARKGGGLDAPARPVDPIVIAIDAGHGGKDTGAIGYNGTYEKDVAYAIARRLERLVRAEPGMRVVMVRKGDVFIALRQRAEIARGAGADLFISVHADAHSDDEARGSAVFTLSPRRVELGEFGENTLEASELAAGKILGEMRKKQALHYRHVQKARFVVLKSPDMPSMLIETGFVSNPGEERLLTSPAYQEKLARSIFNGIRAYFHAAHPVQGISIKGRGVVVASRQ